MDKKKFIPSVIIALLLSACSSRSHQDADPLPAKDTHAFSILINQISENIQDIWGSNEVLIAGPKDYVSYSTDQKTRVHINFVSGIITFETLSNAPNAVLKEAIVSTLLLAEPVSTLPTAAETNRAQLPFLYKQVVDESNHPIRWEWRANQFADYLLNKKVKTRSANDNQIAYVTINLVPNHVDERAHKFLPIVKTAAHRHQLDEALILAIIKVESNYNPYAISRSDALGLMQIQRHTAGRDLYRTWGKSGEPSRAFLFNPTNNIQMGSAYLALLRDKYLKGIKHPLSLKHAMIAAYNGGAGSVLTTFSTDRSKAVKIINTLSPEQVFHKLRLKHASRESRRYLLKVSKLINH